MGTKPTILICSDSCSLITGMGQAAREICSRLYNTGKYDIHSLGWFFRAYEQQGGEWKFPWPQYTIPDHNRPYGHPVGFNGKKEDINWATCPVVKLIDDVQPKIVIAIGDYWMCQYLLEMPNRNKFKLIWEFPLDGLPVPKNWIEGFKKADIPVVMTKFAQEALLARDPYFKVEVNPRGLNTNIFRKSAEPKEALRERAFPEAKRKFVVGVFDRFQDRKQIGRAIESFAKFIGKGRHDDCDIYLHMCLDDSASMNQGKTLVGPDGILKRYNLDGRVLYRKDLTVERGIPQAHLAALYNSIDVKLSTSQGEGFGLTTTEAMACGVPCIGTNYTSFPEFFAEGRGLLADVKTTITGMYNVERALVDTNHVAELLEKLYRSPALRRDIGDKAAVWTKRFNWESNIQNWVSMIERCLRKDEINLVVAELPTKLEKIEKSVNIQGAVYENTGFSIVTRNLALALDKLDIDVSVEPRVPQMKNVFPVSKRLTELITKPKNNVFELINHMQGEQLKRLPVSNAKYRIAYFPWELTRIETSVVDVLNKYADGVWCNSRFTADIFKRSGVQEEKLAVIPNGICLQKVPPHDRSGRYRFLSVGNLGDIRKNTKTLVYAYLHTFTKDDNVILTLKSQPGHQDSDPTALVEFLSAGIDNPPQVEVIHDNYSDYMLAELFASCDCYVTTSHAEGFCQPILEASALGKPIIAPMYGGYLEFAQHENFFGVPVKMVASHESPVNCVNAKWSEVKFKNLCEMMRQVFDNKLKGEHTNFVPKHTWENSAKTFIKEMDKLVNRRKTPKLKVYYENFTRNLWNNSNRDNFIRYAPANVEFVSDFNEADLQILDITRLSDRHNIKCKKYVALFHCFGETSEEPHNAYQELLKNAVMVYSHLDLSEFKGVNFIRGPWGVDENIFYRQPAPKQYRILTTGEIPQTEGIAECLAACSMCDTTLLHVGPNLGYKEKAYANAFNLTDAQMRSVYNSSYYANAMRRIEGFEKPFSEGVLCGARPICFDTPLYRHWYKDIPMYVRESTFEETAQDIIKILKSKFKPITDDERKYVIERFSWKIVARKFWREIKVEGTNVS